MQVLAISDVEYVSGGINPAVIGAAVVGAVANTYGNVVSGLSFTKAV